MEIEKEEEEEKEEEGREYDNRFEGSFVGFGYDRKVIRITISVFAIMHCRCIELRVNRLRVRMSGRGDGGRRINKRRRI